jgi:hypothetical protein
MTQVPRETVRKGVPERSEHAFGRYTEDDMGLEWSFQPSVVLSRRPLKTFRTVSEDEFSEVAPRLLRRVGYVPRVAWGGVLRLLPWGGGRRKRGEPWLSRRRGIAAIAGMS